MFTNVYFVYRFNERQKPIENRVLIQSLPPTVPVESAEQLPPAQSLLSKPPTYPARTPNDFKSIPNLPTERPKDTQRVVPPAEGAARVYNSPVPRTTLYNQRKRAAEAETPISTETASKWKYQRSTTFNVCRQCHLPKTKTFGHSRHVGIFGLEPFCPSVEGKRYPSVDAWLQERRRENPKKEKIILHDRIFSLIYDFCLANYIIPKVAMILISICQVTKFTIFSPIRVTVLCRSDGAHLSSLTSAQLLNLSRN